MANPSSSTTRSFTHPAPEQIERFVHGEASAAENRALVRHLLHGCPRCQKMARRCWEKSAIPDLYRTLQ